MSFEIMPHHGGLDVKGENMSPAEAFLLMENLAAKLKGVMHRREDGTLQWEILVTSSWALPEDMRTPYIEDGMRPFGRGIS